jgi:hypothetical protein
MHYIGCIWLDKEFDELFKKMKSIQPLPDFIDATKNPKLMFNPFGCF